MNDLRTECIALVARLQDLQEKYEELDEWGDEKPDKGWENGKASAYMYAACFLTDVLEQTK